MNDNKSPRAGSRSSTVESDNARRSSNGSRKSPRTSNSNSPSGSSTNNNGRVVLDRKLRSLLSHPLGLPLFYMLHGQDPSTLSFLKREVEQVFNDDENKRLDAILKTAVEKWEKNEPRDEPQLTKLLSQMIQNEHKNTGFHSDNEVPVYDGNSTSPSRIDILFSPKATEDNKEPYTPLALIEVGRSDLEWWKKLDQNFKYLHSLGNSRSGARLRFEKPLLFAALTIAREGTAQQLKVKLGVFLCSPRESHHDFRISLLSHLNTDNLQEASKTFGQLLRATSAFTRWRESADEAWGSYQYFSSNCCRVDQYVLRSYDSRFRTTNRSPEIYLSSECREIVGGRPTVVAKFPKDFDSDAFKHGGKGGPSNGGNDGPSDDSLWSSNSQGRGLVIIATPYRKGGHVAKSAKAFLPVIDQLALLHSKGFVHGDIRAFNTVFGEQDEPSWLIDFDFGGNVKKARYPDGYRPVLHDGLRIGEEKQEIEKWHDWFALGQLIFAVHNFKLPVSGISQEQELKMYRMEKLWIQGIEKEPSESEIKELKRFLDEIDEQGWQVTPGKVFANALRDNTSTGLIGTYKGATGSPPDVKRQN